MSLLSARRQVSSQAPIIPSTRVHDALSLTGVSVSRRGLRLIDDLSCTVTPGQVLGVSGPSGCGKTTLLRCIASLSSHYTGSITVPEGPLAMVFQEPRLLP